MVKHSQTIRRLLPTKFLSVFGHFVGLALKGLRIINYFRFYLTSHVERSAGSYKVLLAKLNEHLWNLVNLIYFWSNRLSKSLTILALIVS